MRKEFAWLMFAIVLSCSGAAAQGTQSVPPRTMAQLPAPTTQKIDPSITSRLPRGAKVHILTDDEFHKLVAKAPRILLKGTESPTVKNPNALARESSVLADLAKQKQKANADMVQARVARPGGMLLPPRAPSPVTPAPRPPSTLHGVQAHPTTASRYARMPAFGSHVGGCYAIARGQMMIADVTGQAQKLVFTPISQYNLYSIHGCNFGDDKPGRKAWIYGLGFHADFQIEAWTDDLIVMKLGENISGVLDQDNLQLVVHRADGKETHAGGFKFFAARDEGVLLRYIPPGWQKLDWNITGQTHWSEHPSLRSNTPVSGPYVPSQAARVTSIYVTREMGDKFAPGSDSFDLGQLPKGWVVQSVSWTTFPANCPYIVTYRQTFGQWNVNWSATGIQLSWADTSCSGFMPNPLLGFPTSAYQNRTQSSYALTVLVSGPRGTESLLPHM
jgi:hypothetical protein